MYNSITSDKNNIGTSSVNGLNTITITYDLNGGSGTQPASVTTVKNLGVYIQSTESSTINQSFAGWSDSKTATLPNYSVESISSFKVDTTLYAIYKTIQAGDYVYYPIDLEKPQYDALDTTIGIASTTQTFKISDKFTNTPVIFRILSVESSNIKMCPDNINQLYLLNLSNSKGYSYGRNAIASICALYATNYSESTTCITQEQMTTHQTTDGLSTLFSNYM